MLNTVSIMGRLGRDPELRQTQSGKSVTSFSLAVDRDFKNAEGEREVDWINVTSWGAAAEFVTKYFRKGQQMLVAGRLQTRMWQDKEGRNREITEVVASNVYFCGPNQIMRQEQKVGLEATEEMFEDLLF